ncbi:MAG: hypothetical protein LBD46_04860, partial [Endomicrobium sp.]|nr:hypothetical protein [Endomicrobium sp.]
DTQIDGAITANNEVSIVSKGNIITSAISEIKSTAAGVLLDSTDNTQVGGAILAKEDVKIVSEKAAITTTAKITSSDAGVSLESAENTQVGGAILAKEDVKIVSEKAAITTTAKITSSDAGISLESAGDTQIGGDVLAKEDVEIVSKKAITTTAAITSNEAGVSLNSTDNTQIGGTVSAKKDVNVNAGGSLSVNGTINSDANISLNSKDDAEINAAVSAVGNILSNIENGALIINDAVKSSLGNIRLNILHNNLFINNKVISENGTVFANVYGNISDDPFSQNAGIYAKEVDLKSVAGNIGGAANNMRIENSDSLPLIASVSALNGEIYVDGFTNGLVIKKFASGQDTLILAGSDIQGYAFAGEREPNLSAKNIIIHSTNGSVGTKDARITVAPINVDPLSGNGKVNVSAYSGIYINQYEQLFYSDYIRNLGYGEASLLVPDNNVYIGEAIMLGGSSLNINFLDNRYKKNVEIAAKDIKKIVIHPDAVLYPNESQALLKYNTISSFKQNIKDEMEKILDELTISSFEREIKDEMEKTFDNPTIISLKTEYE